MRSAKKRLCSIEKRLRVSEPFLHMARDGDLSLAVLRDVGPSPGGTFRLSDSVWQWTVRSSERRSINSNRLAVFTDEVNVVSRGTPTVGI